jgi:hypothetical protein
MAISHSKMRWGWKHWADRNVVVTVREPGDIVIHYDDGCDGKPRAFEAMTLARIDTLAMNWISYTLVMPDGSRTERKGWLHDDFDGASTPSADEDETARRRKICDEHPRSRELSWCCYETAVDYRARGLSPWSNPTPPAYPRPTPAEVEASPL